jgi:hypothetical protein
MSTLVMNYTVNPVLSGLKKFYRGLVHSQMIIGYSRAASELARQGYHEESKKVMMELTKLRTERG